MPKIITPNRQELKIGDLSSDLINFYYNFQNNFMSYVSSLLSDGMEILKYQDYNDETKKELEKILDDKNKEEFPNFNRYVGDLERACHAAQTLNDYDLGIGIAKKGTWLSYVFGLHGHSIANYLIIRGDNSRFIYLLSKLWSKDVKNKKILIFDNDLLTGETVRSLSDELLKRGAKYTDLLLVYGTTRQKPDFYEQILKSKFKNNPKILGESENGEIVLDTTCEIPSNIRQFKTLESDFQPDRTYLDNLIKNLENLVRNYESIKNG